jgi:arylsulfatase A-like enzyme
MSTILPRYLRRADYATALSGKFLNSWSGRRAPPYFDRYAMIFQNRKRRYIDPTFNINGSIRRVSGYSMALIGHHAIKSVRRFERQDRRPWLLYVAPTAPHSPWTSEPNYADARVGGGEETQPSASAIGRTSPRSSGSSISRSRMDARSARASFGRSCRWTT